MVRALRFGNLRHARDGWATLCTLHRHILANSRLRVEERDILATIAWSVRGDAADDFDFQREWFDGELWISCVQSRRRLRALQAQTTSNDEAAYQGVDPYGDHAHEELVAHAPHEGVEQGVEPCGDHAHEELVAVKAESHLRSAGNFHIGRPCCTCSSCWCSSSDAVRCEETVSSLSRCSESDAAYCGGEVRISSSVGTGASSDAVRCEETSTLSADAHRRDSADSSAEHSQTLSVGFKYLAERSQTLSESVDTGTVSSRPFTSAESL